MTDQLKSDQSFSGETVPGSGDDPIDRAHDRAQQRAEVLAASAPADLIDDLPGSRELTDELVEEAYSTFVVAMQRTGTTRAAIRVVLEAVWSRPS